ncbi:Fic family protein [Eggerthellaceae bacterium 3-80]|nr:cell filamentation protein Fic [bacterium D16-34]
MGFLSATEIAEIWGVSERSVRNYCAQGRAPGAFLTGKTWNIPSDATKPARANAKQINERPLLARLREEKTAKIKGGIYHKVQVELTYNSNRIEGSKLSLAQTRFIFETATIGIQSEAVRLDDIIETSNHFRAIDYIIDHAQEPLSETIIKELHHILKAGNTDSAKDWFAMGEYKRLPNEVGGQKTTLPENVKEEVCRLLKSYNPRSEHSLEEIIGFHVEFEKIRPFQDGNGRIGRLIMFKECLANEVVPFIIDDNMKAFYYRGLSEWDREKGYLTDTRLAAQDKFKTELDYFRIS